MRINLLVAVSALSLSLAACSSDDELKPYGDELFPNEQAVPTDGARGTGFGYGSEGMGGAENVGSGSQEDLATNVGDRVFFAYDSSSLTPEAISQLGLQAQWMRQYPSVNVTIEGHADERGTREYNIALGDRRANAVKNYLVSLGVGSNRVQTISYGKERPEILGDNAEGWAKNRRGVTVVQ